MAILMLIPARPLTIRLRVQAFIVMITAFLIPITIAKFDVEIILNMVKNFDSIPTPIIILAWLFVCWTSSRQDNWVQNHDYNFYECSMMLAKFLKIDTTDAAIVRVTLKPETSDEANEQT